MHYYIVAVIRLHNRRDSSTTITLVTVEIHLSLSAIIMMQINIIIVAMVEGARGTTYT